MKVLDTHALPRVTFRYAGYLAYRVFILSLVSNLREMFVTIF